VTLRKCDIVKIFIIALFIIKCNVLCSQATFTKTIDFNANQETAEAIIVTNDNIFLIGSGLDIEAGFLVSLLICKTDLYGNVVWRRTFSNDSTSLYSGLNAITDKNGIIYITGFHLIEPFEETNAFLCAIDPSVGDTLLYKEFEIEGIEVGYRVQWLPDSTILIFGTTNIDDYSRILLMNVDKAGQVIFNEAYGTGIITDTRYFQLDETGNINISYGDVNCDPTGYNFNSIDFEGNVSFVFHSDINCLQWGVPSKFNDGYYIAGYEYYLYKLTFFAKLNPDFSYAWKNYFEPDDIYALWAQYELSDGSVIVYGSKKYNGEPETQHAFLRKIDNLGNTIWEREYFTEKDFYESYIWDVTETTIGELICVGTGAGEPLQESGFLSQNFWLLKLDSLGCLEPGCDTSETINPNPNIKNQALTIYPNPFLSDGTIQINLDFLDLLNITYFEVELTDLSGKLLNEFTIDQFHWSIADNCISIPISRGNAANGIYFVSIKTATKLIGNLKVIFI